jgi:hypothetical protein
MNGQSLGLSPSRLNENNVIVDSGTTLIIVTNDYMNAYSNILTGLCNSGKQLVGFCGVNASANILSGQCFPLTPDQIAAYPPVSFFPRASNSTFFHHYKFELTIQPQQYILPICTQPGFYGFGIQVRDCVCVFDVCLYLSVLLTVCLFDVLFGLSVP